MTRPKNASVTVRFYVKVPAFDYEAKVVAEGDEETTNQMIYRAKELLDATSDPTVDTYTVMADISSITDSHGREL